MQRNSTSSMWDLAHLDQCSFVHSVKATGPIRSIYIPVRQAVAFHLAAVAAVAVAVAIVPLVELFVVVIVAGSRDLWYAI